MKSDTNLLSHHKSPTGAGERGSGLTRDRRNKSSTFNCAKKTQGNSASSTPNSRRGNDNDGDAGLIGHSPLTWIHRFEEWKSQKERKKAEKKRLRLNQRSESILSGTSSEQADANVAWLRGANDSSPVRLCSQADKSDMESFSLGLRRRSSDYQRPSIENVAMLEESSLSRSFSDPFRSPVGVAGQHQSQATIEKICRDAARGSKLPQHPFKRDVNGLSQKPEIDEVRKLVRSGSGRPCRGFSDQSTLSRSTNSYVNTASFTLDPQDETHDETRSNQLLDEKSMMQEQVVVTLAQEEQPLSHEFLYSPVHCRPGPMDFEVATAGGCAAPPHVRGIVAVPIVFDEPNAQQQRGIHPKRINDCSQAMRERANVLQYMHRKASDASSIAGSIPRSPARMSESSSDSPRCGEQASGKSMRFRTSSFSFFDKLSSDLENSTHGLDSLVDEAEFKTESIGRGGSMSSVATDRSSIVDEQRSIGGGISTSPYN